MMGETNCEIQDKRFCQRSKGDREFYRVRSEVDYLKSKYKLLFKQLGANEGAEDVLEVGCGEGINGLFLDQLGLYVGIDRSRNRLQFAKEQHPKSKWVCGDALRLPLVDGSFSRLFCYGLLHHLAADEVPDALKEMLRVCRPGGRIIVYEPNGRNLFQALLALVSPSERGILHSTENVYRRHLSVLSEAASFTFAYDNLNFFLFQLIWLIRTSRFVSSGVFTRFCWKFDAWVKSFIPEDRWQLLILELKKNETPSVVKGPLHPIP